MPQVRCLYVSAHDGRDKRLVGVRQSDKGKHTNLYEMIDSRQLNNQRKIKKNSKYQRLTREKCTSSM